MALAADGGSLKDRAARLLGVPSDGRRYGLPAMGVILVGLVAASMAVAQPALENFSQPAPVSDVPQDARLESDTREGWYWGFATNDNYGTQRQPDVKVGDLRLQLGQAAPAPAPAPREKRAEAAAAATDIGVVITGDKSAVPNISIHAAADRATTNGPATLYEGNAVLSQGDMTLRADTIRVEWGPSTTSGSPGRLVRLIADGNVELTTPKGVVRGGHLEIPVADNGLELERASLSAPAMPVPTPPSTRVALPLTLNLVRLLLPLPPGAAKEAVDNTMKVSMQIRQATGSCAALEKISQEPVLKGSVFMKLDQYAVANLHPDIQRALLETRPGGIAMPVHLDAGVEIFARCD
jgi:hypothetical protein